MKIEVKALVVRDITSGYINDIILISDMYDEVGVEYKPDDIKDFATLKDAVGKWSEGTRKDIYFKYLEGQPFVIHGEAKDIPSIGYLNVRIETKTIEWE